MIRLMISKAAKQSLLMRMCMLLIGAEAVLAVLGPKQALPVVCMSLAVHLYEKSNAQIAKYIITRLMT